MRFLLSGAAAALAAWIVQGPRPPASSPPDPFASSVGPMLARNCAPCHVPGGQMYGRLPFDDPAVVRSHKDSIRRRLKAPEDKRLLEDWLSRP